MGEGQVPLKERKILLYELYFKYNRALFRYAFYILHVFEDAEDALQSTWVKVTRNLERIQILEEQQKFRFFCAILRNNAIDIINQKNRRHFKFYDDVYYYDDLKKEDTFDFFELEKNIFLLDEAYRKPLLLKYIHGYSIREIAQILSISNENVGVRIFRAKVYSRLCCLGAIH